MGRQVGGTPRATPEAAAEGQDFVFACVGNDDDLRAVTIGADGAFAGMKKGAVFVDNTTASAEVARELDAAADKAGFGFLDAPVSGGQAGAENGELTVMVGGDAGRLSTAPSPVIDAYARMCGLMGPAGSGQLTKMINQICIAGLVQGLAEGIHFGKKAGLDIETVIDVDLQGRRAVLADGEPPQDHERRQVRFRLRRRLDAQGPRHLPRRSPPQRRQAAGDRAGRPVLRRGAGDGRQALGHVEPARAPEALTPDN